MSIFLYIIGYPITKKLAQNGKFFLLLNRDNAEMAQRTVIMMNLNVISIHMYMCLLLPLCIVKVYVQL